MSPLPDPGMLPFDLDIQYASQVSGLPDEAALRTWAAAALDQHEGRVAQSRDQGTELVIRIVDEPEGRELNRSYRHLDHATNVLSFPFEAPPGLDLAVLGDLVICAPVVQTEAAAQGKAPAAHWAHMVVHGVLHLLGYDHMNEEEAEHMESLEQTILAHLGFPDPYGDTSDGQKSAGL